MFDIQFLKAPTRVDGVVVYLYRSGAFRRRMKRVFEAMALAEGELILSFERSSLATTWDIPSLLSGLRYCELEYSRQSRSKEREFLSRLMYLPTSYSTVIFAPFDVVVRDALQEPLQVIEEPPVEIETLPLLLEYFVSESPFSANVAFPSKALADYFLHWLEAEDSPTLPELSQAIDEALLLYHDRDTGAFRPPSVDETRSNSRSLVVRALGRMIVGTEPLDVLDLLRALSLKQERGWSCLDLADELCRACGVLIESDAVSGFHGRRSRQRAWVWSLLLLTWTDTLEEKMASDDGKACGDVLIEVEELCREFRRRIADDVNPLEGLWDAIRRAVVARAREDEGRSDWSYRLVQSLLDSDDNGEAEWIRTVRNLAFDPVSEEPGPPEAPLEPFSFRSYSDLVGIPGVVALLRRRFEVRDHSKPLAIVGEAASGKSEVVRLYARTLLCEGVIPNEQGPCGSCVSCVSFDDAGSFGYIEIDLRHPSAETHVREQIASLRRVPFTDRRIVVFKNADGASDVLNLALKPLEKGEYVTTFVVLAEREHSMLPSVLSRCEVLRLAPLSIESSRAFIGQRMPREIDQRIVDVVALASKCLPVAMARSAKTVRSHSAWSLESAKTALGVAWGQDALGFWNDIFSVSDFDISNCRPLTAWSVADALPRLRRALLCLMRCSPLNEAAFVGCEEEFARTQRSLDCLVERVGSSRDQVLADLMKIWSADCVVDSITFKQLALTTSRALWS